MALIIKAENKTKSILLLVGGLLMAPVCFLGLVYGKSFIWILCPQALVVMFLRQSRHAYDSIGAADYPDLAVAVLYYPLVSWILLRADRKGRLRSMAVRVVIFHILLIVLAFAAAEWRNRLWGFGG